ncbi:MAG TPA: hypothetical protein VMR31_06365 [Myxococcota bacterium]|nr:hypothetical protein [Myxococcota bacterium]
MSARTAALLLAVLCAACTHTAKDASIIRGLSGPPKLYTLTNLHAFVDRVYAANFQSEVLIPVCSEVELLRYRTPPRAFMTFRVVATDKEYEYDDHGAAGEPLFDHLALYFGRDCPQARLDALTTDERKAVSEGVVRPGMRKDAVILAIGYPPKASTASLESKRWQYWHDRWKKFFVDFDDAGVVAKIEG